MSIYTYRNDTLQLVFTGHDRLSNNPKTGPMVQAWILPVKDSPAVDKGESVCGECPLRHSQGGGCYVNLAWAPTQAWRAAKPTNEAGLEHLAVAVAARGLRLGAYGDPGLLPPESVIQWILKALFTIGYTRRWMHDEAQWLRPWVRASVFNDEEREQALKLGWCVYYPSNELEVAVNAGCLNDFNKKITCWDCRRCDGKHRPEVITARAKGMLKKKFDQL